LLVCELSSFALEDELEIAVDRGERGPQLVRDRRDELVLQMIELTQPVGQLL